VASRTATIVAAHPLDNADDFENLFGAIRHISLDGYEFMTVVMGGGRAESQVHKLLAALDLLQTVTIVPRLRPVRSVLAAGDIFVRPQPSSAFDPFLLEAMSVGVAVAACRGGVDDLIVDGETAVVFDPNDELSIVTALKQLLGKREFARKIAAAGQEYLRKNHSVSNMISATLQTYRNAELWHKSPDR
jgi:glycosyltransferase involved in cell wall biosynthesis